MMTKMVLGKGHFGAPLALTSVKVVIRVLNMFLHLQKLLTVATKAVVLRRATQYSTCFYIDRNGWLWREKVK